MDTAGHSIFRYDTPTRSWIPLKPTDRIRPLEGYWIYAAADVDIPLSYATGTPQAPPERALAVGWNAIGFSDTRPTAAPVPSYPSAIPAPYLWALPQGDSC